MEEDDDDDNIKYFEKIRYNNVLAKNEIPFFTPKTEFLNNLMMVPEMMSIENIQSSISRVGNITKIVISTPDKTRSY
jgi:hypothetical protein